MRSNWSMEEVVEAFVKSRPSILQFAQTPPEPVIQSIESPKRRLENEYGSGFREPKRLRSSARLSASKGAHSTAEMARQEADVFIPEDEEEVEFNDGLVACPICLMRMKEAQVDKHLDKSCPGSPQPESQRRPTYTDQATLMDGYQTAVKQSAAAKRPDRLPTINYSSSKEASLRKKLAELGISTSGDRKMLERRHREWVTIWNANCDALYPRRKGDLLQDLNTWENTLGSRAPTTSRSINLGAQIKDKDFNQQAWSAQHDSSFKDLIANAKKNIAINKQDAKPESSEHVSYEAHKAPPEGKIQTISDDTPSTPLGTSLQVPIRSDGGQPLEATHTSGVDSRSETGTSPSKLKTAEQNSTLDRLAGHVS